MHEICVRNGMARENAAAEYFALIAIRRSFYRSQTCMHLPRTFRTLVSDLHSISVLFRKAHDTMLNLQGSGLQIASPAALTLTRHEQRLLRAAAAVQADDVSLSERTLFDLAPNSRVRPHLTRAVDVLATSLATTGYWLPGT